MQKMSIKVRAYTKAEKKKFNIVHQYAANVDYPTDHLLAYCQDHGITSTTHYRSMMGSITLYLPTDESYVAFKLAFGDNFVCQHLVIKL